MMNKSSEPKATTRDGGNEVSTETLNRKKGVEERDAKRMAAQKSNSAVVDKINSDDTNSTPLSSLVNAASQLLENKELEFAETTTKEQQDTDSDDKPKVLQLSTNKSEGCSSSSSRKYSPSFPVDANVIRGTKEDLIRGPNHKPTFAEQLYDILENEEHHDVLQWTPNGQAFFIVNHKKFTLYKMATLFNIRNMSSFVRKLGRWGFMRVQEKQGTSDIFRHPDFVRGDRAAVKRNVKCMGRLIAAAAAVATGQPQSPPLQPQHHLPAAAAAESMMLHPPPSATGGFAPIASTALRSDAEMAMPMSSQIPLYQGTVPFQEPLVLDDINTAPSLKPSLDRVTDASAASAEALYLSHRSQQQARMELLLREQHELNEREIQNLLRQREMQQRELEVQRRRLITEQQQLAQEAALCSAAGIPEHQQIPSSFLGMRSALSDFSAHAPGGGSSSSSMMRHDLPLTAPPSFRAPTTLAEHQQQILLGEQYRRQQQHLQERRGLLADQSQCGMEGSSRNACAPSGSTAQSPRLCQPLLMGTPAAPPSAGIRLEGQPMAPTAGFSVHPQMTAVSSGKARARQRKAVIQALLQEEQEWEMKRQSRMGVWEQQLQAGGSAQQQQRPLNNPQQQQQFLVPPQASFLQENVNPRLQLQFQQQQQQQQHMMQQQFRQGPHFG